MQHPYTATSQAWGSEVKDPRLHTKEVIICCPIMAIAYLAQWDKGTIMISSGKAQGTGEKPFYIAISPTTNLACSSAGNEPGASNSVVSV
jgi:hypothetical protein